MPKFILPKIDALLEGLHSIDFRSKIERTDFTATFSTKSIYLEDILKQELSPDIQKTLAKAFLLASEDNGQMILFEDAAKQVAQVGTGGTPLEVDISDPKNDFFKFLTTVDSHPFPNIPGVNPPASNEYVKMLHFYLGKSVGENDFNVVIVPAFQKVKGDLNTNPYLEKRSFTTGNPFFAYITSASKKEMTDKVSDCIPLIANKDNLPTVADATQVVSFSVRNFTELRDKLKPNPITDTPTKFFLQFGRVRQNDNLTIILSFLNKNGPIYSSITTPFSQGVCFDKGDLIPPPDDAKDWDSSFA